MIKLYVFRVLSFIILLTGVSQLAGAQGVYWREGFESGQGFPAAVPYNPTYVASSASGVWYLFLANRTNGSTGACQVNGGSFDHGRFYSYTSYTAQNPALTAADSGFMVTPVVDFGIGQLHFNRGRAARRYTVYKTSDTAANTNNWTLVSQSSTVIATLCADTTWPINDATARRLKIVARSGTDSDIDSVWLTSTSPIVPVKFTGINASAVNGFTKVSWNIATEINTRSYIVEKSTDGSNFVKAAEIPATNAGNYTWIDNAAATGVVYYRVKAIDKDGKLDLSGIVKVAANQLKAEFLVTPNIISGRIMNLQLNNMTRGAFAVRVSNNLGQIVYTGSINNEGGAVSKSVLLPAGLSAGTYRVQLLSGSTVMTQTAVLQ